MRFWLFATNCLIWKYWCRGTLYNSKAFYSIGFPPPTPTCLESSFNQGVEVINDPMCLCARGSLCPQSEGRRGHTSRSQQRRKAQDRILYPESTCMQLKPCQTHPNANRDEYSNWWNALKAVSSAVLAQGLLADSEKQRGVGGGWEVEFRILLIISKGKYFKSSITIY